MWRKVIPNFFFPFSFIFLKMPLSEKVLLYSPEGLVLATSHAWINEFEKKDNFTPVNGSYACLPQFFSSPKTEWAISYDVLRYTVCLFQRSFDVSRSLENAHSGRVDYSMVQKIGKHRRKKGMSGKVMLIDSESIKNVWAPSD